MNKLLNEIRLVHFAVDLVSVSFNYYSMQIILLSSPISTNLILHEINFSAQNLYGHNGEG
jgi:hypothetical protein